MTIDPVNNIVEEQVIRLGDLPLAKALWPFIRPFFPMLALSVLMALAATFFELFMPILIQRAFDGFILPTNQAVGTTIFGFKILCFKTLGMIFSGFILAGFIINFFQTLFMEYTGQKIILNLRRALFSHMTRLPVSYYDKNSSGRLVSRVAGDIENMNEMFTSVLVFMAKDLMLMAGILGILWFINARLAFYLSCMVPVIIITTLGFSKAVRNTFRTIRQKIGEINHGFSEGITGIKIIQTTSSRQRFILKFEQLNFEHFTAAMSQIKLFSLFMPFIGFLSVASVAIIIWTGSFSVKDQTMTLGGLIAFLTYMKLFFRPLRELSEKFNLLQNALASAERIITVLNLPKGRQRLSQDRNLLKKIDRVEFKKIDFSYDKKEKVLKQICFTLDQGKSIGIAGQTGSGKSSIINLLNGFYRPDAGQILINNIDHNTIDLGDIRSRTALVMQDPVLFSGTIRENIRPWEKSLDDAALKSALNKANCQFLFEKFEGLDTRIREGGRPLSSGEKQLVCIARAFAFDPDLIIFDEATSYMDSQSEQKVHDAMKKLMHDRLSIIIAHRLSTIRECDKILLLGNGKIREQGSHTELVDLKGEYFLLLQKEII